VRQFRSVTLSLVGMLCLDLFAGLALGAELEAPSPTAFLAAGMLGIQLGDNWEHSKELPALQQVTCQPAETESLALFDEVCFFQVAGSSRVAGAPIHDGFIVGKAHRVILVGTGIAVKNAEDPLADSVIASFQSQIHVIYQHRGSHVLFANLPTRKVSDDELQAYAQRVPVLLIQLEAPGTELAVLYGYLAPVNAFETIAAD
jgi:hypothetical protein